jgi:GH35 family endo-1,4-beta-xylanase
MRRIQLITLLAAFGIPAFAAPPVITGLDLIDADTGAVITDLYSNNVLDLNVLGQRTFWVRANVSGSGSVHFQESGGIDRTVDSAPYILGGSANGTNGAWMPAPGSYTITATPWEGPGATGAQGEPVVINLSVSDALDHRMRPVRIQSTVPNAQVKIRMLNHAFPFGSMTKEPANTAEAQISQNATYDEQQYQAVFLSNFNYSVVGNAMKWYTQQPDWWSGSPHNTGYATPGNHRYDQADSWLNFQEANGIPVRGHTIFWGEKGAASQTPTDLMHDPDWVEALGTNALYWMEQRVSSIVSRYAGRIDEWDFNNELWHGDWYRDTFGSGITKQMADWAVAANPNIKLWFNEYGMLNNSANASSFRSYLQVLQGEGVQIDGVGVQGHFGSAPNPTTVKASLDILDDLGLPIKVTEFDCGWVGATETQEADGLETVYRIAFEHPAVEGIIMWGFWEGNHWKPERALWRTDWTPTEQALRYQSLVFDEWWSDADLYVDQNGELPLYLFGGDFEITIDGKTFTTAIAAGSNTLNLAYDGTDLSVSLGAGEWIELTNDDFESGWGNWLDGGADALLSSINAIGAQCMNLQDDTATSESELAVALDLTGYTHLRIAFTYLPVSMENGEDFWVRFSADGGVNWSTIKAFVSGADFSNDVREYPVLTIDRETYNFTSNVKIKFECDASGNADDVYIDDVIISGFIPAPPNQPPAFAATPFSKADAAEAGTYADTIAGSAADADAGDTLTYSKVSGPVWLNVATNGTLSGLPGYADVGTNVFTVKVEDAALASDTAILNITVVAAYDLWVAGYGLTGSNALASADLEPDSMNNFLEYASGGNPTNADSGVVLPAFEMVSDAGTNWMEYVYRRRNDHALRGLVYTVEVATNLVSGTWTTNGVNEVGSAVLDDEFDSVTNRVSTGNRPEQFMRLRIEQ